LVSSRDWLQDAARRLGAAGIEDASAEARFLFTGVLGLSRSQVVANPDRKLDEASLAAVNTALARRVSRVPLSQILGATPFWTLELLVTPDVLSPRADTETIVEAALNNVDTARPLRILDIATGSGAIALALLTEMRSAHAVATDISRAALDVAAINAGRTGLSERIELVCTSWADGIAGRFDLVVSNPPYIASSIIETLEPEVRDHEPRLALDGGPDGLAPYRHLFNEARRLLAPGGTGVFEIGYDQREAVLRLAREAGARDADCVKDLGGRSRAIVFDFG
jgi:release factor glutamine methyltransferase